MRRTLMIPAVLIALFAPAGAGAITVGAGNGGFTVLDLAFPGGRLEVELGGVGGPIVEMDNDPMIGETGRGGSDFAFERDGLECSGPLGAGATLVVDDLGRSATFVSTIPGCEASVLFEADPLPGAAATVVPRLNERGGGIFFELVMISSASASGTLGGQQIPPPEEQWVSQITRSWIAEAGFVP